MYPQETLHDTLTAHRRAANHGRPTVEDVGINHGRLHVVMAQKLLHRPNIAVPFQQMRFQRVPERMACGSLCRSHLLGSSPG